MSYEDIRQAADHFLDEHHPARGVPIPIEEIIEFRLRINIIPLPGLHKAHGIDGFISADMTEISVDDFVFESRPGRYRFTLAHEVGHVVLHGDDLKRCMPDSVEAWKDFITALSDKSREWLEWQAHSFAGLVLAPRDALRDVYRRATGIADREGLRIEQLGDIARDYIARYVGTILGVSPEVVERRLRKDGIW